MIQIYAKKQTSIEAMPNVWLSEKGYTIYKLEWAGLRTIPHLQNVDYHVGWNPSTKTMHKLNVDGAALSLTNNAGIGGQERRIYCRASSSEYRVKLWAVREWFELVKEKHFTKIHRFIAGASSYSEGHSSSNPWYGRSLVGFYHWEANK